LINYTFKNILVQSESDFMPERASPSGFSALYHFQFHPLMVSLSEKVQERVFRHLKG